MRYGKPNVQGEAGRRPPEAEKSERGTGAGSTREREKGERHVKEHLHRRSVTLLTRCAETLTLVRWSWLLYVHAQTGGLQPRCCPSRTRNTQTDMYSRNPGRKSSLAASDVGGRSLRQSIRLVLLVARFPLLVATFALLVRTLLFLLLLLLLLLVGVRLLLLRALFADEGAR